MELQTTIGRGLVPVIVEYTATPVSVLCWDGSSGREYEDTLTDVDIDNIWLATTTRDQQTKARVEVSGLLDETQFNELQMACQAAARGGV